MTLFTHIQCTLDSTPKQTLKSSKEFFISIYFQHKTVEKLKLHQLHIGVNINNLSAIVLRYLVFREIN